MVVLDSFHSHHYWKNRLLVKLVFLLMLHSLHNDHYCIKILWLLLKFIASTIFFLIIFLTENLLNFHISFDQNHDHVDHRCYFDYYCYYYLTTMTICHVGHILFHWASAKNTQPLKNLEKENIICWDKFNFCSSQSLNLYHSSLKMSHENSLVNTGSTWCT